MTSDATPPDGPPPHTKLNIGRAMFTTAHAVIPRGVNAEIVPTVLAHGPIPVPG